MGKEKSNEKNLDHLALAITPEDARYRLENMGYKEKLWDDIITTGIRGAGRFGSHETQALIIIARGEEPQVLGVVYKELRVKEGLPPERTPLR